MHWQNSPNVSYKATSSFRPRAHLLLATSLGLLLTAGAGAQQATPIGRTSAKEVNVSGAVEVHNGEMLLGNGSAITAGDQAVNILLTRGGQLRLCATTAVHLSHDNTINAPDSTALMMSLDRGAIEANYDTGKYSDVLITPDLRILISGPGHADLKIRVNQRGDTCIDNHGANAPYITVSSQLDGGLYRIQPNQHVTLEHGSLTDVVDTETEPCGCPVAPLSVASDAAAGKAAGGPKPTPADTAFPLAESEGLAPPAALNTPAATAGETHAHVDVPLTYSGESPAAVPPSTTAPAAPAPVISTAQPPVAAATTPSTPAEQHGFLHRIGHFFSRVFGGG